VSRGLTYYTSKQLFISDAESSKRTPFLLLDLGTETRPSRIRGFLKGLKVLSCNLLVSE
jgi:hypothetical protein